MRRRRWLALVALALALAAAPLNAQDDEESPPGDDSNPFNLSQEERDTIVKFTQLETTAIRTLQERDFEGAERRYRKLIAKLDQDTVVNEPTRRRMQSYAHYNLACTYSLDGQTEPAIEEFEKSLELGFWGWKHIKKDTDLDNIRDEDAFVAAVKKWKKKEAEAYVAEEERLIAQVTSNIALRRTPAKGYDYSVTTTKGDERTRAELKGKVVVMHVFQPYSEDGVGPEIQALVKLHHDYKKKGVVVLGLAVANTGADVGTWLEKFVEENDVKFELAGVRPADQTLDPYNRTYGQTKLWFLDKKGRVRGTAERLRNYEALQAVVDKLLE
jgi:hypothetical protein